MTADEFWGDEWRRWDKTTARNRARAERDLLHAPWSDPHFVNILRRVYRDYIKRRVD